MRGEYVFMEVQVQMLLKGWNSHLLADRTGISYPSLRRKMRGESPFTLDEAFRIRRALGCDMDLDALFARRAVVHDG